MKKIFIFIASLSLLLNPSLAQNTDVNTRINLLLLNGQYEKVIDTCKLILASDSLNSDIYYKLGIAYENSLDDASFKCFYQAARLNPNNTLFSFSLAKGYYGRSKYKLAKPLLNKLCSLDSLNWAYAYYLSSIYMQ